MIRCEEERSGEVKGRVAHGSSTCCQQEEDREDRGRQTHRRGEATSEESELST